MSAEQKPRLKIMAGRPVEIGTRETPVQAAKRRYGKPFAFERGAKFEWKSGPSVLDQWLFKRRMEK